jgi:hypothetical protein
MTTRTWGVAPGEHAEGPTTRAIEHYTSMAPSGFYLSLAVGCMGHRPCCTARDASRTPSSSASGCRRS